jgi:hypothetical protein
LSIELRLSAEQPTRSGRIEQAKSKTLRTKTPKTPRHPERSEESLYFVLSLALSELRPKKLSSPQNLKNPPKLLIQNGIIIIKKWHFSYGQLAIV